MHLRPLPILLALLAACSADEAVVAPAPPDALTIALAPLRGDTDLDRDIAAQQAAVRTSPRPAEALERLGTLFVARARRSHDDGCYKLAEQCALAIEAASPGSASARLLRGHVQQSLHAFAEAEATARALVAQRGIMHDWGLLGDVLVDRGALREALDCYQRMLDQKPCLQSYTRAAHVRWLRGDVAGARHLLQLATTSGSPRDPESLAWTWTRLGTLALHGGDRDGADRACARALALLPGHAGARLLEGRVRLAQDRTADAVEALRRAVELQPLPEHRWLLADALRLAGRESEAQAAERELELRGAQEDPRSFALWLATRGRRPPEALALVERELRSRADVHTHDAHAWALWAAGRVDEARAAAARALAEGTPEPRFHLHAGVIALAAGAREEAGAALAAAERLQPLLHPSERAALHAARASL